MPPILILMALGAAAIALMGKGKGAPAATQPGLLPRSPPGRRARRSPAPSGPLKRHYFLVQILAPGRKTPARKRISIPARSPAQGRAALAKYFGKKCPGCKIRVKFVRA